MKDKIKQISSSSVNLTILTCVFCLLLNIFNVIHINYNPLFVAKSPIMMFLSNILGMYYEIIISSFIKVLLLYIAFFLIVSIIEKLLNHRNNKKSTFT